MIKIIKNELQENAHTDFCCLIFMLTVLGFIIQSLLCLHFQLKPEVIQLDVGKFGKKMKGISLRDRGKEDHGEKEASAKPAEPTRIKIFEGGYVKIFQHIT